jgi:hypothetical protein
MVECGPTAARHLQKILSGDNPEHGIAAYEKPYPFSLAFYNMKEELEFLQHARKAAGSGFRVVGVAPPTKSKTIFFSAAFL